MKSEVLFRGQDEDGEWHYGSLRKYSDKKMSIAYTGENGEEDEAYVIPETVGVFIGYRALNYERIFEGDILKTLSGLFLLVTDSGYGDWTFTDIDTGEISRYATRDMLSSCKIVDNIHDNPAFAETYVHKF